MSEILVINHPCDRFLVRDAPSGEYGSWYLLFPILLELEERGHHFTQATGIPDRNLRADAAIVHVDATVVPAELVEYAASFPVCLNSRAGDISKRMISGALIQKGDAWKGPVIAKSNLNYFGQPEIAFNQQAALDHKPLPFPNARLMSDYCVYDSLADVPPNVQNDADLVLEKFIPEPDPEGFAIRFWVFCGDREHCNRYVSPDWFVKGSNAIRKQAVPVPDELRERRRDLGFDYGKFDFVIHEGKAVLLDANKTPAQPPPDLAGDFQRNVVNLADGFESILTQRSAAY
jgi:hypothetical protein